MRGDGMGGDGGMRGDGVRTNAAWWYLDRHLGLDTADALCIVGDEGELTYRQLHELVCRTARVLDEAGLAQAIAS